MKLVHGSPGSSPHRDITQPSEFTQFSTRYEPETRSIWCWMQPEPRPCLNTQVLDELFQFQLQLTATYRNRDAGALWPFRFLVLASKIPGVFNLGGDLELFRRYILSGDEQGLREYAHKAVSMVFRNINNLDLPITTIGLVQGQALGGGFETALSCDVLIAERSSQLGFPEILFNLFPGMGAYNLLARRIGAALAERIILSGETYSASELYEIGVIDILADDGEGVPVAKEYMRSRTQSHNTASSMKKIRQIVHPITKDSLYEIVDIWVDAAMKLDDKDMAKMDRLLQMQKDTKCSQAIRQSHAGLSPRHGEWRKITGVEFPLLNHLGETVAHNRRKNRGRRQSTLSSEES